MKTALAFVQTLAHQFLSWAGGHAMNLQTGSLTKDVTYSGQFGGDAIQFHFHVDERSDYITLEPV